ncbi:MAG: hypothetical protein M0007_13485 [Actinomycetota bacterium]|nr:hypothetical protein [Actinomycetota bacterium]
MAADRAGSVAESRLAGESGLEMYQFGDGRRSVGVVMHNDRSSGGTAIPWQLAKEEIRP